MLLVEDIDKGQDKTSYISSDCHEADTFLGGIRRKRVGKWEGAETSWNWKN